MSEFDSPSVEERPPFEDDGFITGSITLPGIDMPLTLTRKQYFKFDGVVPDIWRYLASLSIDMRALTEKYVGQEHRTGFNMGLSWNDYLGMFMAVKDVSPRANLSNVAHEAAEVAFRLGYSAELEEHLRGFGLRKTITGIDIHCVGAIAGILIPRSKGINVTDLYSRFDSETYRNLVDEGYINRQ